MKVQQVKGNDMKRIMVLALGVCVCSAWAADYTLLTAPVTLSDWQSDSFYAGGKAPAGDGTEKVFLSVGMQAKVDDSSIGFVSSLGWIVPDTGVTLTVDIQNDAEFNCRFSVSTCPGRSRGMLVKKGSGTLFVGRAAARARIGNGAHEYDYEADFTVEEGVVELPKAGKSATNVEVTQYHYGVFDINTNATLVLTCKPSGSSLTAKTENWIAGLRGAGTLRSESWSTSEDPLVHVHGARTQPDVFSGRFVNNFFFYSSPHLYLTGTNSTTASSIWWIYDGNGTAVRGIVGAKKIGYNWSEDSSIGHSSTIGLLAGGARFIYLGDGETTAKSLVFGESTGTYAEYVDAGAHGGVTFEGTWQSLGAAGYVQRLHLDGSNSVPCVIGGAFYCNNDSRVYCVKEGSGTWRLANNDTRRDCCGWGIENGTLQFDSLAETNKACAFGTADVFGEDVFRPVSAMKADPSAYYFRLGTAATSGTLEYTGAGLSYSTTRPLVLAGDGELKNSAVADGAGEPGRILFFSGVTAKTAGLKTLKLSGDATAESVITKVSDGAGQVKVVKDGPGTWTLSGAENTFTGGLEVRNGTLVYRGIGGKFSWFRFRVREVQGGSQTYQLQIAEFGLYDKDNHRINGGLKRNVLCAVDSAWTTSDHIGNSIMTPETICQMNPGECAIYEPRAHYYSGGRSDTTNVEKMFQSDADCGTDAGFAFYQPHRWLPIVESDEGAHVPVVMRLSDDCAEMVKFDIASTSWGGNEGAKSYLFEGSVDGQTWYTIRDEHNAPLVKRSAVGTENIPWYYSSEKFTTDAVLTHVGGLSASGSVSGHPVVAQGPVFVCGGATLKAVGDVEIPSLKVDLSNGGRIEGVKFPSTGTIDIVNYSKTSPEQIPLAFVNCTGVENVCDWNLRIDGAQSNLRKIICRNGVLYARRRGLAIIFH